VFTACPKRINPELVSRVIPLLFMKLEEERNPTFWTGKRLKILTQCVLSLKGYPYLEVGGFTFRYLKAMGYSRTKSERDFLEKVVFPSKQVQNFIRVMDQDVQSPSTVKPPPIRFMGVGYKDHGSLRSLSFDGTPHWKEVATSDRMREHTEEPKNPSLHTRVYSLGIGPGC
jgi:hypothetical protein